MSRPKNNWPRAAVALGIVWLSGCMVGPKYHQPTPPVPSQFKEDGTSDSGTPEIAYSDWWRVYKGAELSRLETEADAANQDIKLAMARVEQANAGAKYARSFLFPTISLGASASRTREAQDRPNNGNTNGLAATYNDSQMPAFLSYEVDAWGRVRQSIEAANATAQGDDSGSAVRRLAVESEVAMDYFSLREIDAERGVLDATVGEMQKPVDLTTNRFHAGLNSELDALDISRAILLHRP
jgi:outer membrane protein, multidrug efflux system